MKDHGRSLKKNQELEKEGDRGSRSVQEFWRRGWESNPRIKVLQTSPLPLGYRAIHCKLYPKILAPSAHPEENAPKRDFSRGALPRPAEEATSNLDPLSQ